MQTAVRRVALITEVISPYRVPVFNELAKDRRLDLKVFFLAETVSGRKWETQNRPIEFAYEVVPAFHIPLPGRFPVLFNPSIVRALSNTP